MRSLIKGSFIFILIALGFFSCREQGEGWTVDALIPLADSRIDIGNLFDDTVFVEGDESVLTLVYSTNIFDFKLQDFSTPDTLISQKFPGPGIPINWDKRIPLVSDTSTNRLDIDDVSLIEAVIKTGTIEVEVTSYIGEDVEVSYVLPAATKNGIPLRVTRTLAGSPNSSTPSRASETISLDGYTLDLRGKDGNEYNTLTYYLEVDFVDKFNPDTIYVYKPTDDIFIDQRFLPIEPYYGKGIFHTQKLTETDSENDTFDLFDNVISGEVDLKEAKFSLDFTSAIGADMQGKILSLSAVNERQNKTVDLTGPVLGQTANLSRAQIHNNLPEPPIVKTRYEFVLDENNSNMDELIENFPNKLKYEVEFTVNPQGNTSGANDFFYADQGIRGDLSMEIPFHLKASDLYLIDTTEFVTDEDEDLEGITGGHIRLHAENWYPFEAEIQVVLYDRSGKRLTNLLLPDSKLLPAMTNEDGIVTEAMNSIISTPVSEELLDKYYSAETAVIHMRFSTEGEDYKKVYAHYYCGVKIVADVNYNMVIR